MNRKDLFGLNDPLSFRQINSASVLQQTPGPYSECGSISARADFLAFQIFWRPNAGVHVAKNQLINRSALGEDRQADDFPTGLDGRQEVTDVQITQTEIAGLHLWIFLVDHRR